MAGLLQNWIAPMLETELKSAFNGWLLSRQSNASKIKASTSDGSLEYWVKPELMRGSDHLPSFLHLAINYKPKHGDLVQIHRVRSISQPFHSASDGELERKLCSL
jgi:hypothetical protein